MSWVGERRPRHALCWPLNGTAWLCSESQGNHLMCASRVGHGFASRFHLISVKASGSHRPPRWLSGKESACQCRRQVLSLGWEDPLEKEKATHSSILSWRIPWTEEPSSLQSIGSHRVRHDLATEHALPQWESQGLSSSSWILFKGRREEAVKIPCTKGLC